MIKKNYSCVELNDYDEMDIYNLLLKLDIKSYNLQINCIEGSSEILSYVERHSYKYSVLDVTQTDTLVIYDVDVKDEELFNILENLYFECICIYVLSVKRDIEKFDLLKNKIYGIESMLLENVCDYVVSSAYDDTVSLLYFNDGMKQKVRSLINI